MDDQRRTICVYWNRQATYCISRFAHVSENEIGSLFWPGPQTGQAERSRDGRVGHRWWFAVGRLTNPTTVSDDDDACLFLSWLLIHIASIGSPPSHLFRLPRDGHQWPCVVCRQWQPPTGNGRRRPDRTLAGPPRLLNHRWNHSMQASALVSWVGRVLCPPPPAPAPSRQLQLARRQVPVHVIDFIAHHSRCRSASSKSQANTDWACTRLSSPILNERKRDDLCFLSNELAAVL